MTIGSITLNMRTVLVLLIVLAVALAFALSLAVAMHAGALPGVGHLGFPGHHAPVADGPDIIGHHH